MYVIPEVNLSNIVGSTKGQCHQTGGGGARL